MPVNRHLFTQNFTRTRVPNWRCPRCDGGHLRLIPDSFHSGSSGDTHANSGEEWFDYDSVELRFVALLSCDNQDCRETASLAGSGRLIEDPDLEAHKMDYSEIFEATHVDPSPVLIRIPQRCPESVTAAIARANRSQWSDADAAATHIRTAVERLLDELQVPAQHEGNGRRINLHDRIERLQPQRPLEAQALLATKWIGNAGAHGQEVARGDVFDMFDILEMVLEQVYGAGEALAALVKAVNERRGPAREVADW